MFLVFQPSTENLYSVAAIPKYIFWKFADQKSELGFCKFDRLGKKIWEFLFTLNYLENRDKQKKDKQDYPQFKHDGAGGGRNAYTLTC